MSTLLVAGIDVGSLSAEVVIMDRRQMISYLIMPTGANSKVAAERVMQAALEQTALKLDELKFIIATGYGRFNIPFAHKQVTEITCHGRGAYFLNPDARTVIDIGGQDSKVIRLSEQGHVLDFVMNEKCAAGTGRFLEVMAQALEVKLEGLADLSGSAQRSVPISSMCTVFAESEVVSLIAQGLPREEIARGLHDAIAERTAGLVYRIGLKEKVVMTGGVAKNSAVLRALEEKLKVKIDLPPEPQIVGALGAAILAGEEINRA
jgi:predicted CoA-substrate-specific enzyme activase